jgi:transposase
MDKGGQGGRWTEEEAHRDTCSIGIDVAKAQLDIAVRPSGVHWVRANDEAGIGEVLARVQPLQPTRIVLEATGGREIRVAAALAAAGLPVAIVNPRQGRHVARAIGQVAKSDALDAAVTRALR